VLHVPLKQRRKGRKAPPDTIVIHWSAGSGDAEAVARYFERSEARQASYHRAIGRDGVTVSMVDLTDTAWHAGDGTAWDERHLNDRSVGLCLCNLGPVSKPWAASHPGRSMQAEHAKPGVRGVLWEKPTEIQIAALRAQIADVVAACPSIRFVIGHDDCARRKIDPGPILDGVDLGLEALGLTRLRRRWDLPGDPWEGFAPPVAAPEPAPAAECASETCPEPPKAPPPPPPMCEPPLCKPIGFTAGDLYEAGFTAPPEPDRYTIEEVAGVTTLVVEPAPEPKVRRRRTAP